MNFKSDLVEIIKGHFSSEGTVGKGVILALRSHEVKSALGRGGLVIVPTVGSSGELNNCLQNCGGNAAHFACGVDIASS